MSPDPTLFFVKQGIPKTEDDWIKLVQRQEVLHQLELEKWHDLLGTATHLLRQVIFFNVMYNLFSPFLVELLKI
jgi:hypothetical protein